MTIQRRLVCAMILVLTTFVLTFATASAHSVDGPSPVHGILDNGAIPAIVAGMVLALTVAWYRAQRGRTR